MLGAPTFYLCDRRFASRLALAYNGIVRCQNTRRRDAPEGTVDRGQKTGLEARIGSLLEIKAVTFAGSGTTR